MSTATSSTAPKFSWDCEVPDTPFWRDLEWKDGRGFLNNFSTDELDQMKFDENLSKPEKLDYLEKVLKETLDSREAAVAPHRLHDVNFRSWEMLNYGIIQMEHSKGNVDKEEELVRVMAVNGPDGGRNFSALHHLAWLLEIRGKYEEAKTLANEVRPWLESNENLGPNSPQVIGSIKVLVRLDYKLGHKDEAEKWIEEGFARIEGMKGSKFEKYYEDEHKEFEEAVAELRKASTE